MKLLITGASGFIGSRLVPAACAAWGAENVIAFSSRLMDGCLSIVYERPGFNLSNHDHDLLSTAEVLIHVGAFTPKNALQANAIVHCNANIDFTNNLLALPLLNLKKIIYISTVDIYAPAEIITENTPTIPTSLYGWSKLYCEQMVSTFSAQHQLTCQILRVGHVYGPGEEHYQKFLPEAMKRIVAGEAVELWGNGSEVRSLIYIDDVVAGILRAVPLCVDPGPINIVGGTPISIRTLLDSLISISGKPIPIILKKFNVPSRNYIFDNSKLRQHLLATETELNIGLEAEYAYMAQLT